MHPKSFPLSQQRLALFVSVVFFKLLAAVFVDGQQPTFTEEPPSNLYVLSGENATFNWKYFVLDREAAFDILSPIWSFYEKNGTERVIGNDFQFDSWNWKIDLSNCPQRLLMPTRRVFREENATLVITKVTTADNGMYGCTLVLSSPPSVKSKKVQLIVTVNPQIKITGKTEVEENATLTLNCSAVGPPTPNVTWLNNADVVLEQGIQSATLTITNITREQAGIYNCNATNNPNEDPVQNLTTVVVQYPVECNKMLSTKYAEVYVGKKDVKLKSVADGVPEPTHVWYLPNSTVRVKNETSPDSSTYTIEVVEEKHIGNWTVNVTNGIRSYYCLNRIEVVKVEPGTRFKLQVCTTEEIIGYVIGLILGVLILAALIGVIIYKIVKEKKKWKDWTTLQKVLILLGFIVAIVIIIVFMALLISKC